MIATNSTSNFRLYLASCFAIAADVFTLGADVCDTICRRLAPC